MKQKPWQEMTEEEKDLLLKLEQIVGNNCYNGNIQNNYMWEWEGEGRWFKYPVTFVSKEGVKTKQRHPRIWVSPDMLRSGYYAFGANQLYIFRALAEVVKYLEDEYGLNLKKTARSKRRIELSHIRGATEERGYTTCSSAFFAVGEVEARIRGPYAMLSPCARVVCRRACGGPFAQVHRGPIRVDLMKDLLPHSAAVQQVGRDLTDSSSCGSRYGVL